MSWAPTRWTCPRGRSPSRRRCSPDSSAVGAFHHLSAVLLEDRERPTLDGDVLVVGDDRAATDVVQGPADRIPRVTDI
jgi:predicted dinucleotide-binding enzyme